MVDGIDFDSYCAISGMKIVEGNPLSSPNDVIIDEFKATQEKLTVGSDVQVFGRTMKVAGIFTPSSGSRIKMMLSTLQEAQAAPDKCTFIMVKCTDPIAQETVLKNIETELPGNIVLLTRDVATGFSRAFPGIDGFIRSVVILSSIVSTLVILIAMYTTITERTREIGILKSLGASRAFIVGVIEREALAISLIGVVVGLIAALTIGWIIESTTTGVSLEMDALFGALRAWGRCARCALSGAASGEAGPRQGSFI